MDDFISQISFDDPNFHRVFVDIIQDLVKKEIKNSNLARILPAEVKSVALDGTLTINLNGEAVDIPGIKNCTGETLIANDEIQVILIGGSASNMVALIKK